MPEAIKQKRLRQIQEYEEHNIKLPTRSIQPQDYHALCRFPARFAFLSKHLDFTHLPNVYCADFKEMRDYITPTKASIIFPSAHINSPASMFGHTFLLLDSSFQSRLLAFAINYQADADPSQTNAISFAFNGLFGLYTGSYSILPYYDKIKEYSNVESRDMWEYELNLTQEEITQLYNHIWEQGVPLVGITSSTVIAHTTFFGFLKSLVQVCICAINSSIKSIHLKHFLLCKMPISSPISPIALANEPNFFLMKK